MTFRRLLTWTCLLVVVMVVMITVSGFVIFNRASSDPLQRADAILVLGGEHDGREQYGLQLAERGYAPVLVLSNPYGRDDPVMSKMCDRRIQAVEVICGRPDPLTTRGEALMASELATERNWTRIIVITWRFHLPRARFVFSRCFAGSHDALVMRDVPRKYEFTILEWESVYLYQYAGFVKAVSQDSCDPSTVDASDQRQP